MTDRMEKLIPYFPNFKKDDVQLFIKNMQEYIENESGKYMDENLKVGSLYKSQIFAAHLIMMTSRLLAIYKAGLGKSCVQTAALLMLYNYTDYYEKTIIATTYALTDVMTYQALCKCTTEFLNTKTGKPNELFKKRVSIVSHRDLTKELEGKTMKELNNIYKNKIVMIDEISKVILSDFASASSTMDDSLSYSVNEELKLLDKLTKLNSKGKLSYTLEEILDHESIINSKKKYIQIWRLTHSCKTMKFMGLTATPINNHAIEYFILCNIFLDLDQQFNIEEISNNIMEVTLEDMSRLKGLITYLENSASTAIPNYQGTVLNYVHNIPNYKKMDSVLKLKFSEMYSSQAEAMYKLGSRISANTVNYQIQCYTSLDGFYGSGSFKEEEVKTIKNEESEENEDEDVEETDESEKITEEDIVGLKSKLVRMSCASMFNEIMYLEKKQYDESNGMGGGCSFIYNKMVNTVNEPLIKMAEYYGFRAILGSDLFSEQKGSDKGLCSLSNITVKGLKTKSKKPTILFISGEMKDKKLREKVLQIFSSKENVDGKIIQCIVGSSVLEMGANIGNGVKFYRICGEWSPSTEEQSRYRVFRSDAHLNLIEKYKALNINYTPEVKIYNCAPYTKFHYLESKEIKNIKCEKRPYTKVKEVKDDVEYTRLNSKNIASIIGFCKVGHINKLKINGINVLEEELFKFCDENVNPFDLIKEHLEEGAITNKTIITNDPNYEILYLYCGILYTKNTLYELYKTYKKEGLIFIYNKNVKKLVIPCINDDKHLMNYNFKALIFKSESEFYLANCRTTYISPAFAQYMVMEKKDMISKRIMRLNKQIALDCKSTLERNIKESKFDYTAECDYEKCNYVCSSDVLETTKSESSFIYENDKPFYDNKETIFSKADILECKNKIYGLLKENNTFNLTLLFKELCESTTDKNFRNAIVTQSIIDILGTKCPFLDSFGFQCFVCINESNLFIKRDNTNKLSYSNIGSSCDVINAISSVQNFNIIQLNVDKNIFDKLITLKPANNKSFNAEEKDKIFKKLSKFKLSSSISKFLELCVNEELNYKKNKDKVDYPFMAKYIIDTYKLYIIKIKHKGETYYINTYSTSKNSASKQNIDKRRAKPNSFRILKAPFLEWKDSDQKDVTTFKTEIYQKTLKMLDPKFNMYYIDDDGGYEEKQAFSYLTTNNSSDYKLTRVINEDTNKMSSRDIKTINATELNKLMTSIYERLYLNKYVKDKKKEMGDEFNSEYNVKKQIEYFLDTDLTNKERKDLLIKIFELLGLVNKMSQF